MTKAELANELLHNMDLTKEQYYELCKLCDDMELERIAAEYRNEPAHPLELSLVKEPGLTVGNYKPNQK